jgi:tetratricopeptide (TPR) repeat protein
MVQARISSHNLVRKLMSQGDFIQALSVAKNAVQEHGPHLLLRTDLASCQYMVGDYQGYSQSTEELWSDFLKLEDRLNSKTVLGCSLGIGKLLEEIGFIYLAKKIYEKAFRIENSSEQDLMLQAQCLRLMCLFPPNEDSSQIYLLCEQLKTSSLALSADLQLALLHADIYFLGLSGAGKRIEALVVDTQKTDFHRRLLAFDFLFECLRLNQVSLFPEKWLEGFDYWTCDPFEKALWDLHTQISGRSPNQNIRLDRTAEMSPMCGLRYLVVLNNHFENQELGHQAFKKMRLLLQTIEPKSRALLVKVWSATRKTEKQVELDSKSSTIRQGDAVLNLESSPLIFKLLELFTRENSIPVEKAIRDIYQTGLDENSFDRLRMLIQRTNKKVLPFLGSDQFISLKSMVLILDQKITLRASA